MKPTVQVIANARLHLGFLDLNGGLGRQFGSLGVALQDVYTHLDVREMERNVAGVEQARVCVTGGEANRIEAYAKAVLDEVAPDMRVMIDARNIITPHAGLGSGTQLALAVGLGISRLAGRSDTPEQIALMLGRGKRSSIGINTFSTGGFVVDGGHGSSTLLPPVLTRQVFPSEWRMLLLLDHSHQGIHGKRESTAFRTLPPLPQTSCAHLCHLVLMRLLPGLIEHDVVAFGSAVTEIQQIVGDHFAPVQGGRYASQRIASLLSRFEAVGAVGFGQSSWGPTGFVLCPSADIANQWISQVSDTEDGTFGPDLEIKVCSARNESGSIRIDQLPYQRVN